MADDAVEAVPSVAKFFAETRATKASAPASPSLHEHRADPERITGGL